LVREINPFLDWRAYDELVGLFKELKPQIVHTHSSKAGVLGRLAAHRAGVPVIIHTYHGFGFHRFQNPVVFRLYLTVERRACKQTNHLVFVSQGNWDWAKELKLTNGDSASLIRSGVEAAKFQHRKSNPEFRRANAIPGDAKVVAMIACLKPQK